MNQTLDTGFDLDECAVVCDGDDFALDNVTDLEVSLEAFPRMGGELLETEGDAFLLLVEVQDDDLDLFIEGDNLFGVGDSAPAEVGDVNQTVHAAEIHEHTVVGDVLDDTFEDLTFFEFGDKFSTFLFLLGLEKGLVGNDHVAEFLIDLDDLEVHGGADEHVVVTDGLYIDLRTGEEGLDTEHIDDHAAFGAGLHITLDDLVCIESSIDLVPGFELAGLLVGENELTFAVFCGLDEDIHLVTDLQIRIVTELGGGDDAFALVTDVDDDLAFADCGNGAFDDLVFIDFGEGLAVKFLDLLAVLTLNTVILKGIPVEFLGCYRRIQACFFDFFCHNL